MIIEWFEVELFSQAIDYPAACSQSTLDLAFFRNCFLTAEKDENFTKIYDCTFHEASHLSLECPVTECQPVLQNFRSFVKADGLNDYLLKTPLH